MQKLICVFIVYFAIGFAADRKGEITYGRVFKGKPIPGVTIKSSKDKSVITWNELVNATNNPLRATIYIKYTSRNKSDMANIQNLCGTYETSSFKHRAQLFILKTIANVKTCPIEKGTKITLISKHYTYLYSTVDNDLCGPFRMEVKVFRKNDKLIPIILGYFQGNITGC
ncbi:uncharacterized protein LOC127285498 [Leptopilina boulardi]|uniref:uncharacterized protein LOC127285498 n=1 Tax=Leptopilina boulardi TaxID=63433 RepID=UPI0021F567CE|nr:uncharacterized protein LOC127285498 [Leptopilina boulardi]